MLAADRAAHVGKLRVCQQARGRVGKLLNALLDRGPTDVHDADDLLLGALVAVDVRGDEERRAADARRLAARLHPVALHALYQVQRSLLHFLRGACSRCGATQRRIGGVNPPEEASLLTRRTQARRLPHPSPPHPPHIPPFCSIRPTDLSSRQCGCCPARRYLNSGSNVTIDVATPLLQAVDHVGSSPASRLLTETASAPQSGEGRGWGRSAW
eukprot:364630-Chlamydomonas_euryale.AAC.18